MSLLHMVAAIHTKGLTQTEKVVLFVMTEYVNADTGQCWAAQKEIAEKAEVTRETVGRACKSMQDKGIFTIQPQRRENGSATTNRIIFHDPVLNEKGKPHFATSEPCERGSHGENASENQPSHVSEDHMPCERGSHPPVSVAHTQNLPDITSQGTISRAREAIEDWKVFHDAVMEAAGDGIDMTYTGMHSTYPLRMLLMAKGDGSPPCVLDDVLEAVRKAVAYCAQHGRKLRSWKMVIDMAYDFRDMRLSGRPVQQRSPDESIGDLSAISPGQWRGFVLMSNASGGKWKPEWGPAPGEPGTFVPEDLWPLWKGLVRAEAGR